MATSETVEQFLARGGKITKLPYKAPDRDDPDFSLRWDLSGFGRKRSYTETEKEFAERGFQIEQN